MEKLYRDGKVAVLISKGFGAGWSTWESDNKEKKLFDKDIAQIILDNKPYDEIRDLAEKKYPNSPLFGLDGLKVEWVDKGELFEVEEYDGMETLVLFKHKSFYEA